MRQIASLNYGFLAIFTVLTDSQFWLFTLVMKDRTRCDLAMTCAILLITKVDLTELAG